MSLHWLRQNIMSFYWKKDTPYLALTGRIAMGCLLWWYTEKWPHYNGTTLLSGGFVDDPKISTYFQTYKNDRGPIEDLHNVCRWNQCFIQTQWNEVWYFVERKKKLDITYDGRSSTPTSLRQTTRSEQGHSATTSNVGRDTHMRKKCWKKILESFVLWLKEQWRTLFTSVKSRNKSPMHGINDAPDWFILWTILSGEYFG